MRLSRLAVLGLMLVAACQQADSPGPEVSADPASVTDEGTCDGCEIALTHRATIYDHEGEAGLAEEPLLISRAPDGRVFLVSVRLQPMWFTPSGAFGGMLGAPGEGPSEFRAVRYIHIFKNGIYTYDPSLDRRTTWSLAGEFIDTEPSVDVAFGAAAYFPDGSLVVSEALTRPSMVGLPYHHFDADGDWLKSFGPEVLVEGSPDAQRLKRMVAQGTDSVFWAVGRYEYVIERVAVSGQVDRFERAVDWFPRPERILRVNQEEAFSPIARSIKRDPDTGHIWMLFNVPDPRWREGIGPEEQDQFGFTHTPITDFDRVYDSVIEVFDPDSERVVLSHRLDRYLIEFLDSSHVAAYTEDAVHIPIIEVLVMSVVQP